MRKLIIQYSQLQLERTMNVSKKNSFYHEIYNKDDYDDDDDEGRRDYTQLSWKKNKLETACRKRRKKKVKFEIW